MRIFPKVAMAIFWTFMLLMLIVTATAYNRRSGHTGLDMAKMQQMRQSHEIAAGRIATSTEISQSSR